MRIERDEYGWYLVSDEISLVYGYGKTQEEARQDYEDSLDEYKKIVQQEEKTSSKGGA